MRESNRSEILKNARRKYEQFMRQQEGNPYAQQGSAIVGEVEAILESYFPEFPRHARFGICVEALLKTVVVEMWGDMFDLAELEEETTSYASTVERRDKLSRALDDVSAVTNDLLVEFNEELQGRLGEGGSDD